MGNASRLCANSNTVVGDNQKVENQEMFLDVNTYQAKKKALINLVDEQYGHQLLPNVKELQKFDRKKIEKAIYKNTSNENYYTKSQSPQYCSILESKSTQNVQKVKQNLRQFSQLQILKQKCKKILLIQSQLSHKKMPYSPQLKVQNQSLEAQKQKNQALASKLEKVEHSKK